MSYDLVVLFEHPQWQEPLFARLKSRGVRFHPYDLKRASFDPDAVPEARLYFNQASPSAYKRDNARAVPLALSLMRSLELGGAQVLNGSRAFALELSKSTQAALMRRLGITHPRTLVFNDVDAVLERWGNSWPALLKPEQGGSGARMHLVHSPDDLVRVLRDVPDIWAPDNLLLLQEYFNVDTESGIVRMEFLNRELLYAMRVVSHGAYNLCPADTCNPGGSNGAHRQGVEAGTPPPDFKHYPEVPAAAVETGQRLMAEGGLDVGGIEYLETADGRLVFYDINANSNLRLGIVGFDPFDRVVEFLVSRINAA